MKNFELPPLPFAQDALAPHISAQTWRSTMANTTKPMWII